MPRRGCDACRMMRAGVKTRIALHHTCGRERGEMPTDMLDHGAYPMNKSQLIRRDESEYKRAVEKYVERVIAKNTDSIKWGGKFQITHNRVWTRIWQEHYGVFCFIDPSNGDIHKAGTWGAPQPNGIRGNVYDEKKQPLTSSDFYVR